MNLISPIPVEDASQVDWYRPLPPRITVEYVHKGRRYAWTEVVTAFRVPNKRLQLELKDGSAILVPWDELTEFHVSISS